MVRYFDLRCCTLISKKIDRSQKIVAKCKQSCLRRARPWHDWSHDRGACLQWNLSTFIATGIPRDSSFGLPSYVTMCRLSCTVCRWVFCAIVWPALRVTRSVHLAAASNSCLDIVRDCDAPFSPMDASNAFQKCQTRLERGGGCISVPAGHYELIDVSLNTSHIHWEFSRNVLLTPWHLDTHGQMPLFNVGLLTATAANISFTGKFGHNTIIDLSNPLVVPWNIRAFQFFSVNEFVLSNFRIKMAESAAVQKSSIQFSHTFDASGTRLHALNGILIWPFFTREWHDVESGYVSVSSYPCIWWKAIIVIGRCLLIIILGSGVVILRYTITNLGCMYIAFHLRWATVVPKTGIISNISSEGHTWEYGMVQVGNLWKYGHEIAWD